MLLAHCRCKVKHIFKLWWKVLKKMHFTCYKIKFESCFWTVLEAQLRHCNSLTHGNWTRCLSLMTKKVRVRWSMSSLAVSPADFLTFQTRLSNLIRGELRTLLSSAFVYSHSVCIRIPICSSFSENPWNFCNFLII